MPILIPPKCRVTGEKCEKAAQRFTDERIATQRLLRIVQKARLKKYLNSITNMCNRKTLTRMFFLGGGQ
jgi:hypothetical protein